MCLAIPAKIIKFLEEDVVEIDIGGVQRTVSITLVPEAKVGNYVIIHAGYALAILNEVEAKRTLQLFEDMVKNDQ